MQVIAQKKKKKIQTHLTEVSVQSGLKVHPDYSFNNPLWHAYSARCHAR
jgi:hypothetical protein